MLRSVPPVNGRQHRHQFASPLRRIWAGRRSCEDSANLNGSVQGLCCAGSTACWTELGREGGVSEDLEKNTPSESLCGPISRWRRGRHTSSGALQAPAAPRGGGGIYQSGRNHYVGRQIPTSDGRNMEHSHALHQGDILACLDLRPGALISREDLLENWASFPPPRALPIRPSGHDATSKTVNRAQSTQERSLVRQSQGALWRASYSAQMN